MDVSEVQTLADAMAKQMTGLVVTFEAQTGTVVHSIPVRRDETGKTPPSVSVKIQVP